MAAGVAVRTEALDPYETDHARTRSPWRLCPESSGRKSAVDWRLSEYWLAG